MRRIIPTVILFIISFIPIKALSQYGIDGAVFSISHQIKWASTEKPRLKNIIAGQDKLIVTNTALALSQAKLLDSKKIQYNSLTKADNTIKESTLILQAIESGNQLVKIQIHTFELLEGSPAIEALIIPSETDLVVESYLLLEDIYLAVTEGENSQMNSADRLLFMKDILSRLNALNQLAVQIYYQADQLLTLERLASFEGETFILPLDGILEEIRQEINTIIK